MTLKEKRERVEHYETLASRFFREKATESFRFYREVASKWRAIYQEALDANKGIIIETQPERV